MAKAESSVKQPFWQEALRFLFCKENRGSGKVKIKICKIPVLTFRARPDCPLRDVFIYKIRRLGVNIKCIFGFVGKEEARGKIICLKGRYLSRHSYQKGSVLSDEGIGISLDLSGANSIAQVGRDLIDKLDEAGVNFAVYDTKASGALCESKWKINSSYEKHLKRFLPFKKKILCLTGEGYKEPEYENIITLFWEFESGLKEAFPGVFDGVQSVIAFSDFCYDYFKTIVPKGVHLYKLRYPFVKNWEIKKKPSEVRCELGIGEECFVAYFAFDYNSCYERKNPEAVVSAFAKAFRGNDKAKLLIKTNGFNDNPDKVAKLKDFVCLEGVEGQTVFADLFLSRQEIMEMMNACDVFISLHRGEGLGLGMLEAMAQAKPVIATNFGGNTEFMSKENSFLIDYDFMRPHDLDYKTYRFVEKWADADVNQAADCLRYLYEHPKEAKALGKKAQVDVFDYYSLEHFKSDILKLIKEKQA